MSQSPRPGSQLDPKPPSDRGMTKYYNVDCRVAAVLCYMPVLFLNVAVAGFWLNTEPRSNRFLRFHSFQAIFLSLVCIACMAVFWLLGVVLSWVPFLSFAVQIGSMFQYLFFIVFLLLNFYIAWSALQGEMMVLPIIGDYADQNAM